MPGWNGCMAARGWNRRFRAGRFAGPSVGSRHGCIMSGTNMNSGDSIPINEVSGHRSIKIDILSLEFVM